MRGAQGGELVTWLKRGAELWADALDPFCRRVELINPLKSACPDRRMDPLRAFVIHFEGRIVDALNDVSFAAQLATQAFRAFSEIKLPRSS